jgi:hypothetical protein
VTVSVPSSVVYPTKAHHKYTDAHAITSLVSASTAEKTNILSFHASCGNNASIYTFLAFLSPYPSIISSYTACTADVHFSIPSHL